jgi:tRNA1(Val) A37 N6-methylase TrmN6
VLGGVYHNGGRVVLIRSHWLLLDVLVVAKGGLEVEEVAAVETVIQRFASLVLITWQEMIGL